MKIQLPKNVSELTSFAQKAIKHFQGSPVSNINKLNDAVAKGLNFRSRQQLAKAVEEQESTSHPTPVSERLLESFKFMDESDINSMVGNLRLRLLCSNEDAQELVARTLGFASYEILRKHAEDSKTSDVEAIEHTFLDCHEMTINNVTINCAVFDNDDVDYRILDVSDEIEALYGMISEAKGTISTPPNPANETLMKAAQEELKQLQELGDEYVFQSSSWGSDFVSARRDTKRFNDICLEIIEENLKYQN